jgi:hypothetical protein
MKLFSAINYLFQIIAYDWQNKSLLTIGFGFTWIANRLHDFNTKSLHDFNDIMAAVLKITGLISFIIYVIRNFRPVKREIIRFFSRSNGK